MERLLNDVEFVVLVCELRRTGNELGEGGRRPVDDVGRIEVGELDADVTAGARSSIGV